VTVDGSRDGPQQRSHIFSADASYDVTQMLTLGGKYGVRLGETKPRSGGDWESATAQLAVIRADVHVVKNWDVLLEGRSLWENTGETADFGVLAAIYRHIGDNFEVGVGYNFGRFSDDLRDMTKDDYGIFINAVGKF
jgi:predicted porin